MGSKVCFTNCWFKTRGCGKGLSQIPFDLAKAPEAEAKARASLVEWASRKRRRVVVPALWCAGDKFQSTEQGLNGPLAHSPRFRHHSSDLVHPTFLTVAVNLSPSPKSATNFPRLAGEPFLARQIGVRFAAYIFFANVAG